MVRLLIDAHLDGHARLLALRLGIETWREFCGHLDVQFLHLEQVGLDRTAKDDALWRLCQQKGYYLLTANCNLESEHSLEATIRREGTAANLPVFTLADADRIYQSTDYLDDVVERYSNTCWTKPGTEARGGFICLEGCHCITSATRKVS